MQPTPEAPETVAESRSYVTLRRTRDGYSWTIGANVDATREQLEQAMEHASRSTRDFGSGSGSRCGARD